MIEADIFTYVYTARNEINNKEKKKELEWNVFCLDTPHNKVIVFNVFNNYSFYNSLYKLKKEIDFEKFSQEVNNQLLYCFWSKYEWECVITSWPPKIDAKTVKDIQDNFILVDIEKDREENSKLSQEELKAKIDKQYSSGKKYVYYTENINLTVGEKIDIYTQVMLNWDKFINYLWENKKLIKKIK